LISAKVNGVLFLQFPNLVSFPKLRHGVFTRIGGFSSKPYDSLNLSISVGDDEGIIKRNRSLVSMCMDNGELVFTRQMHDSDIIVVSGSNSSSFVGDALVCDLENKFLTIKIADCQSVLMYDPVKNVVSNVHTGWRGSIKNIIGATIDVMKERFGCTPSDIFAGISPSLGPCCAEFINYKGEIPDRLWSYMDHENHFDFWKISNDQLCDAGVMSEKIYSSGICTKCNTDLFFSYRGEKTTGRFAAVIGLAADAKSEM